MSELTTALETIFSWLKENHPKLEQSFNPGLSYEEIKSYDDKLGDYHFTSEFYELYQWRNGTLAYPEEEVIKIDDCFYILDDSWSLKYLETSQSIGHIYDIEQIIALYFYPVDSINFIRYDNKIAILDLFPCGLIYNSSFLLCSESLQDTMSLFENDIDGHCNESYPSLTARFLDLANSIESNAYFIEKTKHGEILSIDTSKVYRKHRSNNYDNYLFLDNWKQSNILKDL